MAAGEAASDRGSLGRYHDRQGHRDSEDDRGERDETRAQNGTERGSIRTAGAERETHAWAIDTLGIPL
jgi:hypothetical protein